MRLYSKYFSAPRARNDYATHVPILIGLSSIREIRNVLELGCGRYSTLTFLNRSAFPHLEQLRSVENDTAWAETISEAVKNDRRWSLTRVAGGIADAVSMVDLEEFDLILIDDSQTATQRASTIQAICSKDPRRAWVVIHDFEVSEYRRASSGFRQKYAFKVYNPWTGLVWNSVTEARRAKALDRVLKEHAKNLEPDDVDGWVNAF